MGSENSQPNKAKAGHSLSSPRQPNYEQYIEEPIREVSDIVMSSIDARIQNQAKRDHIKHLFRNCISNPIFNRALGCIIGALIGDALGAYCEFHNNFTPEVVDKTMKMLGGGTFSLIPGQFTDDSQLASHLLNGLLTIDPSKKLKEQHYTVLKNIANEYYEWLKSRPFDVGITTRKGILRIKQHKKEYENKSQAQLPAIFGQIFQEVGTDNKESQSNGSLMRIAPMAVLFAVSGSNPSSHQQFIRDQISLMHGKEVIKQAGFLWVNMLSKIINRKTDTAEQFKNILAEVEKLDKHKVMEEWIQVGMQKHRIPGNTNIGWAKIAWTYGVHELNRLGNKTPQLNTEYFRKVMKEIIGQGGDTDTNAAIMGGLLGSLVGFTSLPYEYITKMMRLIFPSQQEVIIEAHRRPSKYEPFSVLVSTLQFIDKYRQKQSMVAL